MVLHEYFIGVGGPDSRAGIRRPRLFKKLADSKMDALVQRDAPQTAGYAVIAAESSNARALGFRRCWCCSSSCSPGSRLVLLSLERHQTMRAKRLAIWWCRSVRQWSYLQIRELTERAVESAREGTSTTPRSLRGKRLTARPLGLAAATLQAGCWR